jgi:hypothetical protein
MNAILRSLGNYTPKCLNDWLMAIADAGLGRHFSEVFPTPALLFRTSLPLSLYHGDL